MDKKTLASDKVAHQVHTTTVELGVPFNDLVCRAHGCVVDLGRRNTHRIQVLAGGLVLRGQSAIKETYIYSASCSSLVVARNAIRPGWIAAGG